MGFGDDGLVVSDHMNNTQFCQLGQYVIPTDSILSIDLGYPRGEGTSGGTNVRVWLRTQGSNLYPAAPTQNQAPHFIDFLGLQAQGIRTWAQHMSKQGGLTVILGPREERVERVEGAADTPAGTTPTRHRRTARAKAKAA
jgi:hypothetical protein